MKGLRRFEDVVGFLKNSFTRHVVCYLLMLNRRGVHTPCKFFAPGERRQSVGCQSRESIAVAVSSHHTLLKSPAWFLHSDTINGSEQSQNPAFRLLPMMLASFGAESAVIAAEEIALKILAFGARQFFCGRDSYWNVFDFVIVSVWHACMVQILRRTAAERQQPSCNLLASDKPKLIVKVTCQTLSRIKVYR